MSEQEWLNEFSNNLQALMRETGMSQRELSRKSGIGSGNICRYVNGGQMPNVKTIVKLAYALDCTTDDLLDFGETIDD